MNTKPPPIVQPSDTLSTLNRVLPLGLGVAIALWTLWFCLNLPALDFPHQYASPILLAAWLFIATIAARKTKPGLKVATLAGLTTALISLLALGTTLTSQPDPANYAGGQVPLKPHAVLILLGFLITGTAIGALSACLARTTKPVHTSNTTAVSRMALVVALAYVPLILIGSLVTSTESGMAVPGWPDTYGSNMFLYPLSLMSQPRIFFEHTHRLFGSMAGLATLLLLALIILNKPTRKFVPWVTLLLIAVIIQGVLGGQRVVLNNPYLGALHGTLGQIVIAYAATLALWMSPTYQAFTTTTLPISRKTRVVTTAALHITLVQLLIGSTYRHLRHAGIEQASHVIWLHIAFAIVVVLFVIIAGSAIIRLGKHHASELPSGVPIRLRVLGIAMHAAVGFQFALGWGAFLAVMASKARPGVPTAEALSTAPPVPRAEAALTTIHQANGALLLTLTMLAWAWAMQLHRAMRHQRSHNSDS